MKVTFAETNETKVISDDEDDMHHIVIPRSLRSKGGDPPLIKMVLQNRSMVFEFEDVPGDGHCCFHSILKALNVKSHDQYNLRRHMITCVTEGMCNGVSISESMLDSIQGFVISQSNMSLDEWAGYMDCYAETCFEKERWGTATEIAALSIMLDINICTVTRQLL